MRKILFLSALDFKDKSIQVIKKTPEAYAQKGWEVDYVTARDNCLNGNYFYEKEINPNSINVIRLYWPFPKLRTKGSRNFQLILNKASGIFVVFKLFLMGVKKIRSNHYDVIYGYELHGTLAMKLMGPWIKKEKKVSRFQGTFLNEMLEQRQYARLLFNIDLIAALRVKSNLLIMTNDGTQGDRALEKVTDRKPNTMRFWVNGVDNFILHEKELKALKMKYSIDSGCILVSVSRLVDWKRVDRCIRISKEIMDAGLKDFKYLIVGEGDKKKELINLVNELGLSAHVVFVGSVPNEKVKNYIAIADFFLSMYNASNVGNPLLEAIRLGKPVVTLNNGDTGRWIKHEVNGLIYSVPKFSPKVCARDIVKFRGDKSLYRKMLKEVSETRAKKLWTWSERLGIECDDVEKLFQKTESL